MEHISKLEREIRTKYQITIPEEISALRQYDEVRNEIIVMPKPKSIL